MGSNRSDLHRLVDELDEQLVNDAAALLRTLKRQPMYRASRGAGCR